MKSCVRLILFLVGLSFASTEFFVGMPNTRNIILGLEFNEKIGVYVKHSILMNDPDMLINLKQQYIRIGSFYQWYGGRYLKGLYWIYGGVKYDQSFWDLGTRAFVVVGLDQGINLEMMLQPFYDSEMGNFLGYLVRMRTPAVKGTSFVLGFKNVPEYRMVERRLSAGFSIAKDDLIVDCEISSPTSWKTQFTRVSVGFIYKFDI